MSRMILGSIDDHVAHIERFQQFLKWDLVCCITIGLLYSVIFAVFDSILSGIVGMTCFGVALVLLVARAYLKRGKIAIAVALTTNALLAGSIIVVLAQPEIFPGVIPVPLLALTIALPYIQGRALIRLMVIAWVTTLSVVALGVAVNVLHLAPLPFTNALLITTTASTFPLICFLLWQFSSRLNESLVHAQATNVELQSALLKVEETVATQARLLEENEQQRNTIHALSVPVLPISNRVLLLPLIGALDTQRLHVVQDEVLQAIYQSHARILILDITGLAMVDTYVAQGLIRLAKAAQLLGVEIALVGIRAEVASVLVRLGISFTGIATYQDLGVALKQILVMSASGQQESHIN